MKRSKSKTSRLTLLGRSDAKLPASPAEAHLETFPNPVPRRTYWIHFETDDFTSVCPVTGQAKGYPFEIAMPAGIAIRGVILADQLKSLDWRQRQVQKAGRISPAVLMQLRKRIAVLLGIS